GAAPAAEPAPAADLSRDHENGQGLLRAAQRFPEEDSARQTQPLALPRRQPLPLHLRRRAGPLLFATKGLPRHPARRVHTSPPRARVLYQQDLRPALHGLLRAAGRHDRLLARAPDPRGIQAYGTPRPIAVAGCGTVAPSGSRATRSRREPSGLRPLAASRRDGTPPLDSLNLGNESKVAFLDTSERAVLDCSF